MTPECLRWGPRFLYERYGLPIYITENGLAGQDVVSLDGAVHDPARIDFLRRYLRSCAGPWRTEPISGATSTGP